MCTNTIRVDSHIPHSTDSTQVITSSTLQLQFTLWQRFSTALSECVSVSTCVKHIYMRVHFIVSTDTCFSVQCVLDERAHSKLLIQSSIYEWRENSSARALRDVEGFNTNVRQHLANSLWPGCLATQSHVTSAPISRPSRAPSFKVSWCSFPPPLPSLPVSLSSKASINKIDLISC